ncbi:histone-lysine N-methyltransferase SETMAR [Trichonephila clavata]|uniref:Histone-lysine N-methyltransferase SETMAR n=1 Tax=Trichonephila clavata TaxID=2740835 RepID=A0A8X6J0R8_TRICU|nr:histone-lysine N-methyltransferase SETMAR [Trichonephila clavata]
MFFLDKGKNESQVAEIVNGVHGSNTITANYVQFWFRRFLSGMPVVKNVDRITEIIKVDWHVSSRSITQELNIDHKTVLNYLHKAEFRKNLDA